MTEEQRGKRRWRPTVTEIDDPVAEDHWEYADVDGNARTMRIVVGRPVPLPDQNWYTPIQIDGFTNGVTCIYGVGPADSLMNAMGLARKAFEHIHRLHETDRDGVGADFEWLQAWRRRQGMASSGERHSISIEAVGGSGWTLTVHLLGTDLQSHAAEERMVFNGGDGESSAKWMHARVVESKFIAAGDSSRLTDLIRAFRIWAEPLLQPLG